MTSFLSAVSFLRGRMFVNPTLYPAYDSPLINCVSLLDRVWEFIDNSNQQTFDPAGFAVLDANGYPTSFPSGISGFRAYVVLTARNVGTDVWCFTWDGAGSIDFQAPRSSGTNNQVSANRFEYTVTSFDGSYPPYVFPIGVILRGVVSNLKIFLKSNEAAMNLGKIVNPDFVNFYKQFYGIRFMNWQAINYGVEGDWNLRSSGLQWANVFRGDRYNGAPVQATANTNDYIAPTAYVGNPSSWVKGMSLLTGPLPTLVDHRITFATGSVSTITTVDSGGTPVAHGMSTGQRYSFPISYTSPNLFPTGQFVPLLTGSFPITVTGATTFTIPVNSSSWTDGNSPKRGMPTLRIKAGSLPYVEAVGGDLGALYSEGLNLSDNSQSFEGTNKSAMTYTYDDVTGTAAFGLISGLKAIPRGMSIELMVAIANECNINPWICVPMLSGDAWDMGVINYVKANLNGGLIAHFEKGNENWNPSFTQSAICAGWAPTYCPSVSDGFQRVAEVSGHISYLLHSKVTTAFAAQMGRVQRVIATWTAQPSSTYLDYQFKATHTPSANLPLTKCDVMAIAPYYEADRDTLPTPKQVVDFKIGDAAAKQAVLASVDAMMNASDFQVTGYVTSGVLTITSVQQGAMDVGSQFWQFTQNGFTGLSAGTYCSAQLTGTSGGVGTYQLANSKIGATPQTIGSAGSQVSFRDAIAQTRKSIRNSYLPVFQAYCVANSIKLSGYEGGWGIYPQYENYAAAGQGDGAGGATYNGTTYTNVDIGNLFTTYHSSVLWGATAAAALVDWEASGARHWNQFQITAIAWDYTQQFGELLSGIYGDKTKPGYLAVINYNSS